MKRFNKKVIGRMLLLLMLFVCFSCGKKAVSGAYCRESWTGFPICLYLDFEGNKYKYTHYANQGKPSGLKKTSEFTYELEEFNSFPPLKLEIKGRYTVVLHGGPFPDTLYRSWFSSREDIPWLKK